MQDRRLNWLTSSPAWCAYPPLLGRATEGYGPNPLCQCLKDGSGIQRPLALQRPHDPGHASLLAAVGNVEPVPKHDREHQQQKAERSILLPQAGIGEIHRVASRQVGQIEMDVMILMIAIFFDAADDHAGGAYLEQVACGRGNQSHMAPVGERTILRRAETDALAEQDDLARPPRAADQHQVAGARMGYSRPWSAAHIVRGDELIEEAACRRHGGILIMVQSFVAATPDCGCSDRAAITAREFRSHAGSAWRFARA